MTNKWVPDATAIKNFRTCPELFRLKRIGYKKPSSFDGPITAGQAIHAGLDTWFSLPVSDVEAAKAAISDAYEGPVGVFEADQKRPLSLLLRIMDGYAEKYPREDDPFEVLETEGYQEATITGPDWNRYKLPNLPGFARSLKHFDYCGIRDLRINLNGQNLIVDHKTTGSYLNQLYFDQFTLDVQMRGYVAMELALGRECVGAYINALHIDTRHHKVKPEHFQRHGPIIFEQEQIDSWARDVELDLRRIEGYDDGERWPQYQGGCTAFFKRCEFFEVCRMPAELAAHKLEVEFDKMPWNPKASAEARKRSTDATG